MKTATARSEKKLLVTLIPAVVFVLILSQRHAGFIAFLCAVPFVVWLLYTLYSAIKNPVLRNWNFYRIVTWCIAFLMIFIVHLHYHQVTREYGDRVAALVLEYKEAHGVYPAEIDQVGISKSALRDNFGMGGYSLSDNNPSLFYAVTYIVFDVYTYNFEVKAWEYKG